MARGFTVIELVVTLAIMAILIAVTAPSFSRFIADQRVKSAASDLFMALQLTRSEAIKLNASVTLTRKSGSWQNGWTIPNPGGGNDLFNANAVGVPIAASHGSVTYGASGRLTGAGTAPTFTIGTSGQTQRCVTVDLSGRPQLRTAAC